MSIKELKKLIIMFCFCINKLINIQQPKFNSKSNTQWMVVLLESINDGRGKICGIL